MRAAEKERDELRVELEDAIFRVKRAAEIGESRRSKVEMQRESYVRKITQQFELLTMLLKQKFVALMKKMQEEIAADLARFSYLEALTSLE